MRVLCGALALLSSAALAGCRAPTEVTLEITTDVPCNDLRGVSITLRAPGSIDIDGFDVRTSRCGSAGEIGSMVLLPGNADDEPFAVRVVGGRGVDVATCHPPDYGKKPDGSGPAENGCIVGRRQLAFLPHEPLLLPVELQADCVGEPCDPTTTCVNGHCVPADIPDPSRCAAPGGCPLGACSEGETQPCYSGPPETLGKGTCVEGVAACTAEGVFGACVGEVAPQAQDCATAIDETCTGATVQCGQAEWQQFVSSTFGDSVLGVAVDGGNGVVAVGNVGGPCVVAGQAFNTATQQGFAAKWDATGQPLWATPITSDGSGASVSGVAAGPAGEVYVTGTFAGDQSIAGKPVVGDMSLSYGFVVKLDPAGTPLWARAIAGNVSGMLIASSAAGVVVAGTSTASVAYDSLFASVASPLSSAFVLHIDSDGNGVDLKAYGGRGNLSLSAVAVDDSGDTLLGCGLTGSGSVDFGGRPLVSAGDVDAVVVRLSPSGGHVFSERFGDPVYQIVTGVSFTPSGNAIVAGAMSGTVDFGGGALTSAGSMDAFLVELDGAGGHVRSQLFGGAGTDMIERVLVDAGGGIVATGQFTGVVSFGGPPLTNTGPFDLSRFMASFDAQGMHRWSRSIPGSVLQPTWLAAGPDKHPVFAGAFDASFDVGLGVVTSGGQTDGFVVKLAP